MAHAVAVPSPSRRMIEVVSPATLEAVAAIAATTLAELTEAARRARDAQLEWSQRPVRERARALRRFRDVLLGNDQRFADVLTAETGKTRTEAWSIELAYVCDAITYWSRNADRWLADEAVTPHLLKNKSAYVSFASIGLVGVIGPSNFPFILTIGEAIPALVAGNAVLIKPSELTPQSAQFGAEIWREAGLPGDLLQVAPGYGDIGEALIDVVDMVCFTGSVATGRKVAVRAAEQLKPCTLELGGKDPMIVLADADLERAANACVWGGLSSSGQSCLSVERVYVEAPVHERFVTRVRNKIAKVRQGAPHDDADIGAMTSLRQLETVERHVADAVRRGATVLAGGKRRSDLRGLYFEPTLLVDVTHDMEVMREETFGPVIPVMKVRNADEAIRLANDSRYGLGASIFTRDLGRGRALARRIEAGGVCVNDCLVQFALTELPQGGVKESGVGRRHGKGGLRKFCLQKSVVVDRFGLESEFNWFPNSPRKLRALRALLNFLYRSPGWRRWARRSSPS